DLAQPRRPVGISFTGEPKQAGISRRNHLEGFDVGEVVAKPGHHFAFLPASTGAQSRSVPHAVFTPCFLALLYSRSVPVQISRSFRRGERPVGTAWSAYYWLTQIATAPGVVVRLAYACDTASVRSRSGYGRGTTR